MADFMTDKTQELKDNSAFFTNLGRKISRMRKEKKLSQAEFAVLMNRDINTLSKIERGVINPKITTLINIAKALDISLIELLNIDNLKVIPGTRERLINDIVQKLKNLSDDTLEIITKQIDAFKKYND